MWKTAQAERAARKATSWSAHFAWGGFIVCAWALVIETGWALAASIAAGLMWEIGWSALASPRDPANRASVVDWVFWIMGAVAGALIVVFWSKG